MTGLQQEVEPLWQLAHLRMEAGRGIPDYQAEAETRKVPHVLAAPAILGQA
jgi:hypothetical protein